VEFHAAFLPVFHHNLGCDKCIRQGHTVSGPEGHDKNQVFYIYVQRLADCAAV
jgi:hypothetical protein